MRRFATGMLLFVAFLVAAPVEAATVRLDASAPSGSSHVAVQVMYVPEGADANAVSGTVTFNPALLDLVGIDDGSVIGLWVDQPALTADGAVRFSGITPGGLGSETARLFTLRFQAKDTGTARFAAQEIAVYADDGKATALPVHETPVDLAVAGYPPTDFTVAPPDTQPPEAFTPAFGRDPSIENGAWFIAFDAIDKGNGVAYYQVLESRTALDVRSLSGNESGWQKASSPYILHDQARQSWIYVRAVDQNGNARIAVLAPANPAIEDQAPVWGIIGGVVLLGAVLSLCWIRRRHRPHA